MIDVAQNYTFGLPIAASSYAEKVDFSLHVLHVGMAVMFVLWGSFFVYTLFRFRRKKNPHASPPAHSTKTTINSMLPDAAVLAFELFLVFMWGFPLWAEIKEEFPQELNSHVVRLTAEQFAWNFQYAGPDGIFGKMDPHQISPSNTLGLDAHDPAGQDDIVSINQLHVPIGKPTLLYMRSKDVIHSFFVPEMRNKQDVVPGLESMYWFEPIMTGRFEIVCAQLCGLGHYRMRGELVVHTPEDYKTWLKLRMAEGGPVS